jgi:hypothetical protein
VKSRLVAVAAASSLLTALAIGGSSLARHQTRTTADSARPKFAVLSGANEISPSGRRNAGDRTGRGSFTMLRTSSGTLCFGLVVNGIADPTAAHVHRGRRGRNGPIVITLGTPNDGNPGSSSGCLQGFSPSLTREIVTHPSRFYVNVHNADFPGGALRGQLVGAAGLR